MNAQTSEMTALQEQLAAISVDSLQLSANHVEMTEEYRTVKLQSSAGVTVSDDPELVARACERLAKRTKMKCQRNDTSTATSTAAFSALLAEQDDFKNRCKALNLESQ